jgi:hypothetical protein
MGGRVSRIAQLGRVPRLHGLFRLPAGGVKGLFISGCTLMSGVIWALVIMKGSALAPHLEMLGYVMTGVVAFLMCIQAKHLLLSFVPGTFMGRARPLQGRATGSWWSSLALGLLFGYAMKNSGLWLASRTGKSAKHHGGERIKKAR